jgi:uncharacterized protein (DUF4415 family)
MRKEYDFKRGKRGTVLDGSPGKTRITIRIDDDVLEWFREQAHAAHGASYQGMMNGALREYIASTRESLTKTLRTVIREELVRYGKK